jgi:hypothetical protein
MPWHTDTCHRFTVIVRGDQLPIEYRDSGEEIQIPVQPGATGWDEPDARIHRGINTGATPYEEVVTFYLESPKVDPQPEHARANPGLILPIHFRANKDVTKALDAQAQLTASILEAMTKLLNQRK